MQNIPLKQGMTVRVEGDSKDLWLSQYNCRISTHGILLETPKPTAKKVLVRLQYVDGYENTIVLIRKSALKPLIKRR